MYILQSAPSIKYPWNIKTDTVTREALVEDRDGYLLTERMKSSSSNYCYVACYIEIAHLTSLTSANELINWKNGLPDTGFQMKR